MSNIEELRISYKKFSMGYLGSNINNKFALISMICHVYTKVSLKKPGITIYDIIKQIIGDKIPEEVICSLSVLCEDFAYGCTEFPTFGIADKQMPAEIKNILSSYVPF